MPNEQFMVLISFSYHFSVTVKVAYCEPPGDQKYVHNRDTSY